LTRTDFHVVLDIKIFTLSMSRSGWIGQGLQSSRQTRVLVKSN